MKAPRPYSDMEIACYVLGLDMAEDTAGIQTLLAHEDAAAARALKWEAYLLDIVDALPPSMPSEATLQRIEQTLGMTLAEASPALSAPGMPAAPLMTDPGRTEKTGTSMRRARMLRRLRLAGVITTLIVALLAGIVLWAIMRTTPSTVVEQSINLPPE